MTSTRPAQVAPTLAVVDGVPTTTSLDVAKFFGKRHGNVLRDIRDLIEQTPAEFHRLNFEEASTEVEQPNGGKVTYPMYRLTRDGFTLLAMGFTGKKALAFKVAYIAAFNKMETALRESAALPHILSYDTQSQRLRRLFDQYPAGMVKPWEAAMNATRRDVACFDELFQQLQRLGADYKASIAAIDALFWQPR
jgi:Rha family phage regulatory protein